MSAIARALSLRIASPVRMIAPVSTCSGVIPAPDRRSRPSAKRLIVDALAALGVRSEVDGREVEVFRSVTTKRLDNST